MLHCRGVYVIAMAQTLNFVAMMSGSLMSQQNSGKLIDATIMLKREDFVVGMVQTSLYQSAAAVDAPTNAEMETFAMAVL
jgi:hypothetical protein